MRNGRLPFPSQFADITMAECDQRIAELPPRACIQFT